MAAARALAGHGQVSWSALVVLALLALLQACPTARAVVYQGTVGPGFHYIDKFVFDTYDRALANAAAAGQRSKDQVAVWSLTRTGGGVGQSAVVFFDDIDFQSLLDDDLSCDRMLNLSRSSDAGLDLDLSKGQSYSQVVWQASRPRFWFSSIANCDPAEYDNSLQYTYELEMLNPGGFFKRQFSVDKQGVFELYIAAAAGYIILLAWCVWLMKRARNQGKSAAHAFRALSLCICMELFSVLLRISHLAVFAVDGRGIWITELLGEMMQRVRVVFLMSLLINVMAGWGTSYEETTRRTIVCNVVLMALLLAAYGAAYIWELATTAASSSVALWESPPGYAIIAVRLIGTGWFLFTSVRRYSSYGSNTKRAFFFRFALFGLAWFLSMPLAVVIAAFLFSWIRFKLVVMISAVVDFLAVAALVWQLRPTSMTTVFQLFGTIVVGTKGRVVDDPSIGRHTVTPGQPNSSSISSGPGPSNSRRKLGGQALSAHSSDAANGEGTAMVIASGSPTAAAGAHGQPQAQLHGADSKRAAPMLPQGQSFSHRPITHNANILTPKVPSRPTSGSGGSSRDVWGNAGAAAARHGGSRPNSGDSGRVTGNPGGGGSRPNTGGSGRFSSSSRGGGAAAAAGGGGSRPNTGSSGRFMGTDTATGGSPSRPSSGRFGRPVSNSSARGLSAGSASGGDGTAYVPGIGLRRVSNRSGGSTGPAGAGLPRSFNSWSGSPAAGAAAVGGAGAGAGTGIPGSSSRGPGGGLRSTSRGRIAGAGFSSAAAAAAGPSIGAAVVATKEVHQQPYSFSSARSIGRTQTKPGAAADSGNAFAGMQSLAI